MYVHNRRNAWLNQIVVTQLCFSETIHGAAEFLCCIAAIVIIIIIIVVVIVCFIDIIVIVIVSS